MQVSQGGIVGTQPAVLARFQQAAGGLGGITGPYRGYLYYWKTTRNDDIDAITCALWPYLSSEKRDQLATAAQAVGRATPNSTERRSSSEDTPWAAGLFDGEGSLWVSADPRLRPDWRGVAMELAQASIGDVPETLQRFHAAVRVGQVSGPRTPRNPWTKLPQYRWRVGGRHRVSSVVRLLWPWLSEVKRGQIRGMAAHLDLDAELL
jgi:hypothetical protein